MFEALRKMIFPIIIIVLVFFTAMIFLQWGMGLSGRQDYLASNLAAVINGEEISWQEYNRIYNNLYQIEIQNTEDELPDHKIKELQQSAWQQLLQDRLLTQQVAKHGIIATDEELYGYLRLNPPPELRQMVYFQTDGKFDYQKYINAMADPNAATFWASIEPFVRKEILKLKMQEMVSQMTYVTEAEIKESFLESEEKIRAGMVNVGFERFSRPPPTSTEEELLEFYEKHREQYTINERAALNIVMIEKKPEPYDWEISYNKAKAIYDSIAAGADFTEMAKTYSQDVTAEDGGDLGWFREGQMVMEFNRRVFSMKGGDISEPVRTEYGWHIIQALGFREEMEVPLGGKEKQKVKKAHASHILIKATPSRETLDKAFARLGEFQSEAVPKGFLKAAKDLRLSVKRTGPFFRGRNIQYIGNDANAGLFAFDNEVDEISEVFENDLAIFVVQVAEKLPAGTATFEETEEKVKMDVVKYKVETLCRDTANAIYEEIKRGTDIKKAAGMFGEEYDTPDQFSRGSYVKGIRRAPEPIGRAFSLTEPGQISEPIDYDQGTIIIQLIEKTTPDLTEFTEKRDSIYNFILVTKQRELYAQWFDNLVKNSEIINNIQTTLAKSEM